MSEIVKGYKSKRGMLKTMRHFDDDTPVLILPIEDGKVGDFERRHLEWVRWVINDLHEQGDKYTHLAHKAAEVHEELYAAISRLFEEVESED